MPLTFRFVISGRLFVSDHEVCQKIAVTTKSVESHCCYEKSRSLVFGHKNNDDNNLEFILITTERQFLQKRNSQVYLSNKRGHIYINSWKHTFQPITLIHTLIA